MKHVAITLSILLSFLSQPSFSESPKILGSNVSWNNYVTTINDIKVSNLRVKQVRLKNSNCPGGYQDVLELDGGFNDDTVFVLEKLLSSMMTCTGYAPEVTLNSGGGELASGIEVGKTFRKYGVTTRILDGQKCQSSCSTAWLGGEVRKMSRNDSELLMHSPYIVTDALSISCVSKSQVQRLRDYYIEMLDEDLGELLFDRTMKYCSTTDGWRLNHDAAKIFGLLADKGTQSNKQLVGYEFKEDFVSSIKNSRKMVLFNLFTMSKSNEVAENIVKYETELREVILGEVSNLDEQGITGIEGREFLAKSINHKLNLELKKLTGKDGIENVLFTSFTLY